MGLLERIEHLLWGSKITMVMHAGWMKRGMILTINRKDYKITRIKGATIFVKEWKEKGR